MKVMTSNFEKLIAFSPALVTLFVTTKFNIDPVNLPKLFVLAILAFGLLGLSIYLRNNLNYRNKYSLLLLIFGFFLMSSALFSKAPWQLTFYGADARNTGVLAYFSLAIISYTASLSRSADTLKRFVISIIFVGLIEICYGFLQINGIDFVDWKNIYHTALGSLGNPNFFAAFIGLSVSAIIPFLFTNLSNRIRFFSVIFILLAIWVIALSKSIQGFVTIYIGFITTLLIFTRYSKFSFLMRKSILGLIVFVTGTGLLGILQIGPMANILYKPSISLRGFYWKAGIRMFENNPIFGVGPDVYGNWYRKYRTIDSVKSPGGMDITSNAAHNVFIDFLANGGIFVFISYVLVVIFVSYKAYKLIFDSSQFNAINTSLVAIWIGYLAQSFISINQLGLAVWGWVSGGLIVASSYIVKKDVGSVASPKSLKIARKDDFSNFALLAGLLVGLFLALPAMKVDHDWYSAVRGKDLKTFMLAAKNEPLSSKRLVDASNLLLMNNYGNESRELNKISVKLDPNYYYTWLMVEMNPLSTISEKNQAINNLHRLDPLNPKWK